MFITAYVLEGDAYGQPLSEVKASLGPIVHWIGDLCVVFFISVSFEECTHHCPEHEESLSRSHAADVCLIRGLGDVAGPDLERFL